MSEPTTHRHDVDPRAMAVDAVSDSVRAGGGGADETGAVQLTTGETFLSENLSGGSQDDVVAGVARERAADEADTTVAARHADETVDAPGPHGGREGQGADGDTQARLQQNELGGP